MDWKIPIFSMVVKKKFWSRIWSKTLQKKNVIQKNMSSGFFIINFTYWFWRGCCEISVHTDVPNLFFPFWTACLPWTKTLLYWITLQIVKFLYLMILFNGVSRCQIVSVGFRWCQGISNGVWECQAPTNPIWNLLKPPGTIQSIFSDFIDSMTLVTDCDLQCLMNIHICICSRK